MPAIDPEIILMLCSLLGAGAVAGITTGLFGVGGGFIIVPTLLAILPMFTDNSDGLVHTAIGTSLASIIVSSFRAVQTHRKNDLVDFSVLKAWAPWLLIGVAGGVVLASYMDATALIVVFAVGVLVYSIYFIFPQYFEPKEVPWSLPQGFGLAGLASALGGFSALLGIGGGPLRCHHGNLRPESPPGGRHCRRSGIYHRDPRSDRLSNPGPHPKRSTPMGINRLYPHPCAARYLFHDGVYEPLGRQNCAKTQRGSP